MFEDIKDSFSKVIEFSQGIRSPKLDILFKEWLEAKRDIIEAFGGKLIYECPGKVQFSLDEKEKQSYFNEFVNSIDLTYHNNKLVKFLNDNSDGFYDNTVNRTYEDGEIKVPKGMKLIKAFKFFEEDKNLLEHFQNLASQLIQENKIEGTLCFSVHPLDYITSSVNTYNWRSCHSLDGDYRAGNLSYMLDKSTIICYLKGADDVNLPAFPYDVKWNSKKWRVLIFLSDKWDMLFAGRQYPFSSKSGLDLLLNKLLPALKLPDRAFTPWESDYIRSMDTKNGDTIHFSDSYIPIRRNLYKLSTVIENGDDHRPPLHFNDLLQSTCYTEPYYSIKDDFWWFTESIPHFTIGSSVPCLHCEADDIYSGELMVCRDCAEEYGFDEDDDDCWHCECCGRRLYDGDSWYTVEGAPVCAACFETECFECEQCHELLFNYNNRIYDRDTQEYLCTHCYKVRKGEE